MDISIETSEQTEKRLIKVLRKSEMKILENAYYFKETSISDFHLNQDALAMVRDEDVWSYLIPAKSEDTENFQIFSFHFEQGLENSGFVGWLASLVKNELGSGLFVICGQNSNRGGIFDYWGCPIEIAKDVLAFINKLRE